MANMSTHVQRAWDDLRGRITETSDSGVAALRDWMTKRLMEVSKKLPPLLEEADANAVWHQLLDSPLAEFAVRKLAWDEFTASLTEKPPTFDPEELFAWARQALWSLCVFIDSDEACDQDQFVLELWWSERDQKAAFVCGLGCHWEFRRREAHLGWKPHVRWERDTDTLMPASRRVVVELFPDVELLTNR